MTDDQKEKALIQKIRELAGQIGRLQKMELPEAADSQEYCFQVRCGLSSAVVEILDYEPAAISQFHRYLIAGFVDPDNPRIAALLDALDNEIESQLDTEDEQEGKANSRLQKDPLAHAGGAFRFAMRGSGSG